VFRKVMRKEEGLRGRNCNSISEIGLKMVNTKVIFNKVVPSPQVDYGH
jgi:hypothetical protein